MVIVDTYIKFGSCVLLVMEPLNHLVSASDQEPLDSEYELKRMLTFVRPLMGILRSDPRVRRSTDMLRTEWVTSSRAIPRRDRYDYGYGGGGYGGGGYGGGGYGGGGYGGGGYGSETCCEKHDYLGLVSLIALGLLFLFLIQLLSTTKAAARQKRSTANDLLSLEELLSDQDIVLLDGPTWLSMVHELWEQDTVLENTICTQETLCRMNRLAMSAPGQAGWAVSLSSLPLSYLLHTRHVGGFTSYMDAAMMGRSGANCTELYSSCPRLSH